MKKQLHSLAGMLLFISARLVAPAHAQKVPYVPISPVVGLVGAIAAQNAANKAIANKTTTTVTYHGQTFLQKRTSDDILTGLATDRIAQLETQLASCYTILLADTLKPTCPPEQQATIRAAIKYIDLARPNWDQKAYRQEFRFYLAEDKRRSRASN